MKIKDYPYLEERYGEIAWDIYKRDQDLIDKIIENNNKAIERLSKVPKQRKKEK